MADDPPTYHLWLKPSGGAHETLAALIAELALELNAPVFEPHVTLLSLAGTEEERHVRGTVELARRLDPFPIVLNGLSYRSEYFQCLFATVQETSHVLNANAVAREVFNRAEGAYMPHVSLLYGLYPDELKRQIIERVRSRVPVSFQAEAIHLIRAASRDPKDWHDVCVSPMLSAATGSGGSRRT